MLSSSEIYFLEQIAQHELRADGRGLDEARDTEIVLQGALPGQCVSTQTRIGECNILTTTREILHDAEEQQGEAESHLRLGFYTTSLAVENSEHTLRCQAAASMLHRALGLASNLYVFVTLLTYGPSFPTVLSLAVHHTLRQHDIITNTMLVSVWLLGSRWIVDATVAEEKASSASLVACFHQRAGNVVLQDVAKRGTTVLTMNEFREGLLAALAEGKRLFDITTSSSSTEQ